MARPACALFHVAVINIGANMAHNNPTGVVVEFVASHEARRALPTKQSGGRVAAPHSQWSTKTLILNKKNI